MENSQEYSLQSDVKKAIDAKAYPKVSADIRHQLGTLRYRDACQDSCKHMPLLVAWLVFAVDYTTQELRNLHRAAHAILHAMANGLVA